MKKILVLLTIMAAGLFISCDSGEDTAPPVGKGTVEVKVTYTGTDIADPVKASSHVDGTGRIYVYLLNDTEIADTVPPSSPAYSGNSDVIYTSAADSEKTITISNVPEGDYYVLIFYDYERQDSKTAGKADKYALYNSTALTSCTAEAETITVTEDITTTLNGLTFANSFSLQPGSGGGTGGTYMTTLCPVK